MIWERFSLAAVVGWGGDGVSLMHGAAGGGRGVDAVVSLSMGGAGGGGGGGGAGGGGGGVTRGHCTPGVDRA